MTSRGGNEKSKGFNAALDFRTIEEAFLTDPCPPRPPGIKCSFKAWKQLIRIKQIEPHFLPNSEYSIWLRARQIGLDPK